MNQWPATLPKYLLMEGLSESLPSLFMESDTDVGPPKRRARALRGPTPIRGRQLMSIDQWEALRQFYLVTLRGGALPFEWEMIPRRGKKIVVFKSPPARAQISRQLHSVTIHLETQ